MNWLVVEQIRPFWPGILGLNVLIGLFEVWMSALWYVPWWQTGWQVVLWEADIRLPALPSNYLLAFFPGALELRVVEERVLFRAKAQALWFNPWHGQVYLQAQRLQLELRAGVSPLFLYPALFILPHAALWVTGLALKDVWLWHRQQQQLRQLLHYLRSCTNEQRFIQGEPG